MDLIVVNGSSTVKLFTLKFEKCARVLSNFKRVFHWSLWSFQLMKRRRKSRLDLKQNGSEIMSTCIEDSQIVTAARMNANWLLMLYHL